MSSTSRSSKESKEEETSQYSDAALARRSAKPVNGSSTFWSARQTTCARKEKRLTEVAKKLEHVHFSKTLKLNVGGQLFSTSLETMKRHSGTYVFELTIKSRFINYRTNLAHMHDLFSTRFHVARNVFREIWHKACWRRMLLHWSRWYVLPVYSKLPAYRPARCTWR